MRKYCLGFAFNPMMDRVALIRKTRPEWQSGLLNGIGGKVEDGEGSVQAMRREFHEETAVLIPPVRWRYFAAMNGPDWTVDCFVTVDRLGLSGLDGFNMGNGETVVVAHVGAPLSGHVRNIEWLIPMARMMYSEPGRFDCPNMVQASYSGLDR